MSFMKLLWKLSQVTCIEEEEYSAPRKHVTNIITEPRPTET